MAIKELKIKWCAGCDTFYLECPVCGNNSCNGGGKECCKQFDKVIDALYNNSDVRATIDALDWDKTKSDEDIFNA